ncbi:GDSL-type esterase/lipase family protein [Pseudoalteromonas sp. 2CM37A]|uniref:GDSL-type esterase/lipase family protein n=1 Tax=Pseudoalteromonas sp. 2CM37A TaxID=2929853 RepID=UPI0020BF97D9|nr:GDSL-type esterase/lipase family protein [Pseudoalteromonas sp. 2CM37A]MCK8119396.1 GDSL-type esterase/lipase family protein [Pseudoalteromonas sp. 2CM37A]
MSYKPSNYTLQHITFLLGTLIIGAVLISFKANAEKAIPFQSQWLKKHYAERIAHFKLQPLCKGDIVFVGDSITEQGLNWSIRFNDLRVRNRGISGDMTYGVLARLNELKAAPPKAIFLKIGVNDIFNYHYIKQVKDLASVSENIEKIVTQLNKSLPNTQIYVQSILPDHRDFITQMTQTVNQQIKAIEHANFTYIDLHTAFLGAQGTLNETLTTDGTHLNKAGYDLWAKQLASIMKTLK